MHVILSSTPPGVPRSGSKFPGASAEDSPCSTQQGSGTVLPDSATQLPGSNLRHMGPNVSCHDAPFSADALEYESLSPAGKVAWQVFWLIPAAKPSRILNPVARDIAASRGTYSSGNCCRFSRHSHLITPGATPFVNHAVAKI